MDNNLVEEATHEVLVPVILKFRVKAEDDLHAEALAVRDLADRVGVELCSGVSVESLLGASVACVK